MVRVLRPVVFVITQGKASLLLYAQYSGELAVAVLNSWGRARSWGCHMVHHALYQKQNYSYAGVIEALSGAP